MIGLFFLVLYIFINVGAIAALWYTGSGDLLRKLLFFMLLSALVFSGNVISIVGFQINIGVLHVLNYYLIRFALCDLWGPQRYIDVLRDHFYILLIAVMMTLPLGFLQTAGHISGYMPGVNNLIDDILIDRFTYMTMLASTFYMGQLCYAHSYDIVKKGCFWFEFLVRLPAVMIFQSVMFYVMQVMALAQKGVVPGKVIDEAINLIMNGTVLRYIILLCSSLPFYSISKSRSKKGQ